MPKLTLEISELEIQNKVQQYANKINEEYKDETLCCVGIMNGALFFMSDLLKRLTGHIIVDVISASSYEADKSSNKLIYYKKITKNITNKHVLIIEDIIDTGFTLNEIIRELNLLNPKSIRVVSLIEKIQSRQKICFQYDVLFNTPPNFLVGYGLDYNDCYRQLPNIYKITNF